MKRFLRRRRSAPTAFTLVELLVVIAIIAILAGVILSAGNSAIRAAKRAQAANLATQIQTGVLSYYTEYSVYPVPASAIASKDYFATDGTASKTDWQNIIWCLCGNKSPTTSVAETPTPTNTRAIAFLQLKASDVTTDDCPKNPLSVDSVNKPYFNMGIDNDYSGVVGDTGTPPTGGIPNFSTSTQGSMMYFTAPQGPTGGVIVWANCNTTTTTTQWNPAYFVRTY